MGKAGIGNLGVVETEYSKIWKMGQKSQVAVSRFDRKLDSVNKRKATLFEQRIERVYACLVKAHGNNTASGLDFLDGDISLLVSINDNSAVDSGH